MQQPLVSIIIPVYNAEKYLAETIESALNQTWKNKEIIIVNDGSTDKSLAIALKYQTETVKVLNIPNSGASVARNRGLAEAKGAYIQFLDADDIISKDKIASQIECLKGSDDIIAVCSTIYFKDSPNVAYPHTEREWYSEGSDNPIDFLLKLYAGDETIPGYGGMIQPNAWLTPRKLIEKAGKWNEFRCPDDDGEYFCRVILVSKGVRFSYSGFNYYRQYFNSTSLSAQKSKEAFESIYQATNLKYKHLKNRTDNPIVDKIFARYYWWTGILAYPQYKELSKLYIQKAVKLGYTGQKYTGGPWGHVVTKYLGWKTARLFSHYKHYVAKYLKNNNSLNKHK